MRSNLRDQVNFHVLLVMDPAKLMGWQLLILCGGYVKTFIYTLMREAMPALPILLAPGRG